MNNVFYQPPTNQPYVNGDLGDLINCVVKNNIVYQGRMFEVNTQLNRDAMQGCNYCLTDCENAHIDPLLVSPAKANVPNDDFRLQSGSPAINAGIDVGLTTDYLGNPIIGLPDIGAFEYQSVPIPTVYWNMIKTGFATRNNCEIGYTGSTETYSVLANKYSSTISQSDADNKATNDLNSNKQDYANANGICTAIPPKVYYNISISGTATKNDCGTGFTGSTEAYSVLANKYSSIISQSDADNKATNDLNSNKQAYANTIGICTAIPPTIYYNISISGTATKNDCGPGYTGSTLIYSVLAKKYSSTISQSDADSKATTDLNTNKQAYANANGTCTAIPPTIYYNISISGTATKNDCEKGLKGSVVTYTVSAKKYSSTISQSDANNKALTDLNSNKQSYANINGTCSRNRK